MYLGSPRMAEMVIGEITTLEEMGGARMHATVSGCGDNLAVDDADAIAQAQRVLLVLAVVVARECRRVCAPGAPARPLTADVVPAEERAGYDMHDVIDGLVDAESVLRGEAAVRAGADRRVRPARRRARRHRRQQPDAEGRRALRRLRRQGGAVHLVCDAFNVPLVFLADVPGFMVGTAVERQGIIRHGAKMITAVSEATVPKVSVIVRKAYGAGLYAMSGPAFEPEATHRVADGEDRGDGPEAAVNAVFANKIAAIEDPDEREAFVAEQRARCTRRTSTCCASRPSSWSTRSSSSTSCARDRAPARASRPRQGRAFSDRRHGVPPV